MSSEIINNNNVLYLPISELINIYNIDVRTTTNSAVVLSLHKALTTTNTAKNISLKQDKSGFSKTIEKLDKGTELVVLENNTEDNWMKVLTYECKIGYIKIKDAEEVKQIRSDMEESDFVSKEPDIQNAIELNNKKLTTDTIKDFSSRKIIVQDIISKMISSEKYTVNINLDKVEIDEKMLERFIIELIPRLKEIGGSIVITNNNILTSEFLEENNL